MYSLQRDVDGEFSIIYPDEYQKNLFLVYLDKFTDNPIIAGVVLQSLESAHSLYATNSSERG